MPGYRANRGALANLEDDGVDAGLHVDEHVLAPQPIDDLGPRDELLPSLDEQDEEVHGLPFEPHGMTLPAQLVGGEIELAVPEPQRPGAWDIGSLGISVR